MSDQAPQGDTKPAGMLDVAALERELAEFKGIVDAIRDAMKAHTTVHLIRSDGIPISPGLLMSALLIEAANVCTLWGLTQNLRPDDIEDVFSQALRNARRVLRGNLHAAIQDDTAKN